MWARIENGVVVELTDVDPEGRFHPSFKWVACGADVAQDWQYAGSTFVPPLVSNAGTLHAAKVAEINLACERTITAGFWSEAIGARHLYSSQLDDQLNLTGVILGAMGSLYACRDELGVKEFRPHTAEQLRRVGDDFTAFKLQLLQKANELKQRLDKALADGDLAAMESVTWESAQ